MSPKTANKKKVDPVIHDLACAMVTVFFREGHKTCKSISKGAAKSFYEEYLRAVDYFSELDLDEIQAKHERHKSKPKSRRPAV